jgi:hypothetical protein
VTESRHHDPQPGHAGVDGDRGRLVVISLAAIATGAVIMLATRADPPARPTARAVRTPAAVTGTQASPLATPTPTPPRGVTVTDIRTAKRIARRFLAGYLSYTYGRRQARAIPATRAALRRALADQPPRVRRRDRRRRPRVELLQAGALAARRIDLVALVDDHKRRYQVQLTLELRHGRWLVTDIGG